MSEPSTLADSATLDRFAAIVGGRYALRAPGDMAPYASEPRGLWTGAPAAVLRPGSVEEVSAILRLASQTGTPVVPQGGNTGLVGGQMPDKSGRQVILSLSRLNRIRELDVESATITVEAGAILQTVQQAADDAGLLFPLSLASQGTCQIGGNLSSNAGGTGVLAYGNARELCLGVEVVLPTGEILDDLRKLKKDNTGYDLKNLFVGSEGTLGVITAAVMKLFPRPKGREVAWIGVESPRDALALFNLATERAGPGLTAFELVRAIAIEFAVRHIPLIGAPLAQSFPWYVLMEVSSGRSAEDALALAETVLESGYERGLVRDAAVASSIAQQQAFWKLRESLSEAQKFEGGSIKHDISVPVARIPEFIDRAAVAVEKVKPGARVCCFGHMGDGNLHYNISESAAGDPKFLDAYPAMNRAVHDIVGALGGSFSAEHGIGQLKRDELLKTAPAVGIDLMRRIKSAFDPAGIMNPGKVI